MSGRIAGRLLALVYSLGWAVVRWLPEPLARAVSRVVANAAWLRQGAGVRQLTANLRRVVGEDSSDRRIRELGRAALRSYCWYWMEVFRLSAMSREYITSRFHLREEGLLWNALGSGRGVILALPHSGNWDHAGAWVAVSGCPFTTVAERLHPESLYDRFVAFRERLGMEVLPLTGGDEDVYAALAQRLRAGGLVCLLADRDLTASGVEVMFFGEPARLPAGPAALAVDTGAALIPVTLWYEADAWGGRIHEEIAAPATGERSERIAVMTQTMADAFAESIAAHPQDWHMLQRLWTADLDQTRLPAPVSRLPAGQVSPRRRGGAGG